MHLIYSALRHPAEPEPDNLNGEQQLRFKAYKAVCAKYQQEIAAIQKYFPNWKPRFNR